MKMRSGSFVGLSVGDKSIACVEVTVGADRREVRHAATFPLEANSLATNRVAATGQALTQFLREQGFSASRAVVGVPAKWLIAVERELPPAGEEQARSMLRLQAERLSVSEAGELVFDFVGRAEGSAARKILLVGIPKTKLAAIESLLDAAGLSVLGVGSSSLTLACGVGPDGAAGVGAGTSGPVVVLGRQGAELVLCSQGSPRVLRHVSTPGAAGGALGLGPLGSELSRSIAMTGNGASGGSRDVVVWDGVGLTAQQYGELAGRVGLKVTAGDAGRMLRVSAGATNGHAAAARDAVAGGEYAPAISLALAGADEQRLPLDFLRSRLAPPKPKRISDRALYGGIAGTILVGALAWLFISVVRVEGEADEINQKLKTMAADVKTAEATIATTSTGRGYFDRRTPVMECMREFTVTLGDLTKNLRSEDKIYLTGMTFKENGRATIVGKASNAKTIDDLLERMRKNKSLADARSTNRTTDAGKPGQPTYTVFTITFTYVGK